MTGETRWTTVGPLPTPGGGESPVPTALTRAVWLLWVASVAVFATHLLTGWTWTLPGLLAVDGLTVLLWTAVTFLAGLVHSYARRYLAGTDGIDAFFAWLTGFTLVVTVLVAADALALFWLAWLAMGLVMADLVGHVEDWTEARAAARLSRRYFLASSGALAAAFVTLWWATGATTVSGVAATVGAAPETLVLVAAGALVLAAMIQSALFPFHGWLLSSMTAPTPASALMHAGFVNAGGILLLRFAPVVTVETAVMLLVVLVGATSALLGKFFKTVRTDVKGSLGCSTSGQMGFMLLQAGLGFFAAAITHLLLHGCYKAYQFLASGSGVARTAPPSEGPTPTTGPVGYAVTALTALAGGAVFAVLTGKGMALDGGLLLTLLVVVTTLQAARTTVRTASLSATLRYAAVPAVALPAIALYAAVYTGIKALLAELPGIGAPVELTPIHALVALAFLAAYVAIESGVYRRSERLYVALLNASQPSPATLTGTPTTSTEDSDEF